MEEISNQILPLVESEATPEIRQESWREKVDSLLNAKLFSLSGFTTNQLQRIRDAALGISTKAKEIGQVAALAGGITLLSACGSNAQQAEATAPPDVSVTSAVPTEIATSPTRMPEVNPPTDPTSLPTETPEVLPKQPIHLSGYLSYSEDHIPLEEVKISLPKEVAPNEILTLGFTVESEFPVLEISFPLSKWMGISDVDWLVTTNSENGQIDIMSEINKLTEALRAKGITIDNPQVMTAADIIYFKTEDGNWFVGINLPDTELQITDQHGTRLVNPAETLRQMGSAFYVKRFMQENTRLPNEPPMKATGVQVSGPDGQLTVAEDFDIQPPAKINHVTVQSGSNTTTVNGPQVVSVATVTPTPESQPPAVAPQTDESNTRVITVQSSLPGLESVPEQTTNQSSDWTKEWQPNERVPMKQWWDEMVSKGYIQIDSLARQYGGEQLETLFSVINKADLVPNRQGFPEANTTLVGNCETELRNVVNQGQGHITVSSEAFGQIPGGSNCEIIIFGQ